PAHPRGAGGRRRAQRHRLRPRTGHVLHHGKALAADVRGTLRAAGAGGERRGEESMNKGFGNDDDRLAAYVRRLYAPEDENLRAVRTRSAAAGLPDIQVAPLDGRHLEVLVRMTGVRRAVEVGTLGGYSGVSILRGMLPEGILTTLELEAAHVAVAAETF